MNFRIFPWGGAIPVCLAGLALACVSRADTKDKNPTSKFFVADLNGDAQVDTGSEIDDLTKKSVYNAQGTTIETKPKSNYAMVYSNGTGVYFDPSTKVDVEKFEQEPFRPNRTDMDVEPSISQTRAHVEHGIIGICTSKQVAGSNMNYSTPQGSVNIRGRKVVIEVGNNVTKVSMIEGDSTVKGGEQDVGGHAIHDGQQATITSGGPGRPPTVEISDIPPADKPELDDKVTAACVARKTVYFDVAAKTGTGSQVSAVDTLAGAAPGTGGSTSVSAFDAPSVNANSGGNSNVLSDDQQVIVAVQVVPQTPPATTAISPAFLTTH